MNEFSKRRTWGPTPNYHLVEKYVPPRKDFVFIAGSCSFETTELAEKIAKFISLHGATHMRSGVFRAGTYPGKSFGWIDESLIKSFHKVSNKYGLKNIVEILDYRDIKRLDEYADCFQIGCRAMQQYTLIREVGASGKPVFLKRHPGSTVDEWLGAAEHVLASGCRELYLIERGSSTYHNDVRWAPTPHTILSVSSITQLPVIYDASHSCGRRDMVSGLTLAGVACGASGVLVETHPIPKTSLSDSDQGIDFETFEILAQKIRKLREVL